MIFPALIIALGFILGMFLYTKSQEKYHIRPRVAFAQVAVIGRTEDSENMQITATLFEDETPAQWDSKLQGVYVIREDRLKHQNERMIEIHANEKSKREEAEAALKEAGLSAKITKIENGRVSH